MKPVGVWGLKIRQPRRRFERLRAYHSPWLAVIPFVALLAGLAPNNLLGIPLGGQGGITIDFRAQRCSQYVD
jgi:hypothetical protein